MSSAPPATPRKGMPKEMPKGMRSVRRDAIVVGAVALLIRIPAFFAPQPLGFDDGQFAMSVIAMRHGGVPYRQVFSSQGPLFLPIAWLGDLLTLQRLNSPRAASVLSGVALAVLVLLIGRRLTSHFGAFLGALLVALSGSVLWTTGPLTSDGIGEAILAGAVLASLGYAQHPSVRRAVLIGVLAGAALAVKSLLVIPGLFAAGLWVLQRRRVRDAVLVPLVAVATVLAVSLPWGLSRVYDQYVRYHTDAVVDRPIAANASKLFRTLFERDAPLLGAALIAFLLALIFATRRRGRPRPDIEPASQADPPGGDQRLAWYPVVVWLLGTLAVVLTESPMWRNHVAHVVIPLAILVGIACASGRVAALATIVALLFAPWSVVHLGELIRPQPFRGIEATRQRILTRLPPGALVISDTPGYVWRAGRRVPDAFVDVSILRITSPTATLRLTEQDVVRAAARPEVCAVLRWSNERFTHFPGLGARLRSAGYRAVLARPGTAEVLWVKRDCRPGGRAGQATAAAVPPRSPG